MHSTILSSAQGNSISIVGAMDAEGAQALRPLFEEVALHSGQDVTLDLSAVSYLDGSGVGAIAYTFKRLAARGLALKVEGAEGQPATMLRQLGLARTLGLPARRAPRRLGWAAALGLARAA